MEDPGRRGRCEGFLAVEFFPQIGGIKEEEEGDRGKVKLGVGDEGMETGRTEETSWKCC